MSLGEGFRAGFRGWFSSEKRGKGEGGGEGGGAGWGPAKEPASECASVCRNYPLAIYPLVFARNFCGKNSKSAQTNPLKENPPKFTQQKSATHFCRGAGPVVHSRD